VWGRPYTNVTWTVTATRWRKTPSSRPIVFDEASRYREVQSKSRSKQPRMTVHRDRGRGPAETRAACSHPILSDALGLTLRPRFKLDMSNNPLETRPRTRSAVAGQGQPTNKIGYRTRQFSLDSIFVVSTVLFRNARTD